MDLILISVGTIGLTFGATWVIRKYAIRRDMLDHPNHRSSHSIATPRGGGLSIVLVVLSFLAYQILASNKFPTQTIALWCAALLVALVGFVDDHRDVPAKIRFVVHLIAASVLVYFCGGLAPVAFGSKLLDIGLIGDLAVIIAIVWFTNLFNFMDGIDGIAGVETITVAAGMLILVGVSASDSAMLLAVIISAAIGFLIWNWPRAKIFMGDVGSGFIGLILAGEALFLHASTAQTIWSWLILCSVFIVDATTTLLIRVGRGDKWYSAHRSHAYQILARRTGSHGTVSAGVGLVNVVILLPVAIWANRNPETGWWLTLLVWSLITISAVKIGAGRPDESPSNPIME